VGRLIHPVDQADTGGISVGNIGAINDWPSVLRTELRQRSVRLTVDHS
jgi:hypothetical protein